MTGGRVTQHDDGSQHDPSAPGHRWVTNAFASDPVVGVPTGITLIEYSGVHHLRVEPAVQSFMIPLARDAQRRHGRPKFCIDGRYEVRSAQPQRRPGQHGPRQHRQ